MNKDNYLCHEKLGITAEQKQNLIDLTVFLNENRDKVDLDMSWYNSGDGPMYVDSIAGGRCYTECGSCACLIGHGPIMGIPPLEYERWGEYGKRVFGHEFITSKEMEEGNQPDYRMYDFLFHGSHSSDVSDCINRIRYFLTNGINQELLNIRSRDGIQLWDIEVSDDLSTLITE